MRPPHYSLPPFARPCLRGSFTLGSTEGDYLELTEPMAPGVKELLRRQRIHVPYSHQTQAIEAALQGQDVMVVTGTASGKSLCYTVPIAHSLLSEPNARALMLFPTKALAQDQVQRMEAFFEGTGLLVSSYDGDTPKPLRRGARNASHVILTNPDMLHLGILPQHELWAKFLKSLRYIVIDEAHSYRGVFGGHVAGVLRRLLRLADWHGARPQVIGCSATISEPASHLRDLTGRTPVVVAHDGARKPVRNHFMLTLPETDGETDSANVFVARLFVDALFQQNRTLVFCRSRSAVESVLRISRSMLEAEGEDPSLIDSYRGGYSVNERRAIEKAMFRDQLKGLVSTNAMELGVDIGLLPLVILNGFPGTVSSYWQQAGRVGRSFKGSAVFVAHEDPYDQAILADPDKWLRATPDPARVALQNPIVLGGQLKCAGYERALTPEELDQFGDQDRSVTRGLLESGEMVEAAGRVFYPSHTSPASAINIRGSSSHPTQIYLGSTSMGDMEPWRAILQAHPGAIYLHRGESFEVQKLDLETGEAHLRPFEGKHITKALHHTDVTTTAELAEHDMGKATLRMLALKVRTEVTGYQCLTANGNQVLSEHSLTLPERVMDTIGLRIDLPVEWAGEENMASLHALEHALSGVAPLVASCDRTDVESVWQPIYPETLAPALIFFDAREGGTGLTEILFQRYDQWLELAAGALDQCPCVIGCPKCLLQSRCESGNELLSKPGAKKLLALLLALV